MYEKWAVLGIVDGVPTVLDIKFSEEDAEDAWWCGHENATRCRAQRVDQFLYDQSSIRHRVRVLINGTPSVAVWTIVGKQIRFAAAFYKYTVVWFTDRGYPLEMVLSVVKDELNILGMTPEKQFEGRN